MENEVYYDGTLGGLFALLDRLWREKGPRPRRVGRPPCPFASGGRGAQGLLFGGGAPDAEPRPGAEPGSGAEPRPGAESGPAPRGAGMQGGVPQGAGMPLLPDPAALEGAAGILFQLSADAYGALVYTWMSRLPLEAAALRYALRVLGAARRAAPGAEGPGCAVEPEGPGCAADSGPPVPSGPADADAAAWYTCEEARKGAEGAAQNRGDEDCGAVLAAAYKVAHEIDRLMGFLRFKPDARGRYVARCAPDYLVLPALAPHFTRRFGNTPWAVIDERRGLALIREGGPPRLAAAGEGRLWRGEAPGPAGGPDSRAFEPRAFDAARAFDPWEEIWRSYHRVISIESRKNLRLQGQFIPLRYREYLSEFGSG